MFNVQATPICAGASLVGGFTVIFLGVLAANEAYHANHKNDGPASPTEPELDSMSNNLDTKSEISYAYMPIVEKIWLDNRCEHDVVVNPFGTTVKAYQSAYVTGPSKVNETFWSREDAAGDRIGFWYKDYPETYSFIELNRMKLPDGKTTNPDKLFGPGMWMGHSSYSDWGGFALPSRVEARNADGTPACEDSGIKASYPLPIRTQNIENGDTFMCYFPNLRNEPINIKAGGFLCKPKTTNNLVTEPVKEILDHSCAWTGGLVPDSTPGSGSATGQVLPYRNQMFNLPNCRNACHNVVNYWCSDTCQQNWEAEHGSHGAGAFMSCKGNINTLSIQFCPETSKPGKCMDTYPV